MVDKFGIFKIYDYADFEAKFEEIPVQEVYVTTTATDANSIHFADVPAPSIHWECPECGKAQDSYFPEKGCNYCQGEKISERMGLSDSSEKVAEERGTVFKAPRNSGFVCYHTDNGKPMDEAKLTTFLNEYNRWQNAQPPEGPDDFVTTPE